MKIITFILSIFIVTLMPFTADARNNHKEDRYQTHRHGYGYDQRGGPKHHRHSHKYDKHKRRYWHNHGYRHGHNYGRRYAPPVRYYHGPDFGLKFVIIFD